MLFKIVKSKCNISSNFCKRQMYLHYFLMYFMQKKELISFTIRHTFIDSFFLNQQFILSKTYIIYLIFIKFLSILDLKNILRTIKILLLKHY